MKTFRTLTTPSSSPLRPVAFNAFFLGLLLAFFLHIAEQLFPIRPRWVFVEVALGVVLTLLPVYAVARRWSIQSWRLYERMVIIAFCASGLPITVWQLLLYWPR